MTYSNADALADLEHAQETLDLGDGKQTSAMIKRLSAASPEAECIDSEVHSFFDSVTGGHVPAAAAHPRWKFWKR